MSKYYIPEDFNALEVPLDDGTEVTFEVIMVFEVEGREYIALTPAAEDGEEGDEVEVTMFRYDSGKDEDMLEDIETEEEALDLETYYINQYNSIENGYNVLEHGI